MARATTVLRHRRRRETLLAWAWQSLASWWRRWWRDPDRRRAAMLSTAVHLVALLLVLSLLRVQPTEPEPTYLVIDIGTPALAEEVVEAPTAEDPAPPAERPQVADVEVGEPQAAAAPEPTPATPDPTPQTVQPPAPAQPPAAPEVAETAPSPPRPEPALPAPAPEVPVTEVATTPLPEIEAPELDPSPLAQRVTVPLPAVALIVPEVRAVAPTPQVTVAAPEPVPLPQIHTSVAEAAPVPTPQVAAQVAAARPVAVPDVQTSVAASRDVGVTPQLAVAAPRPVPTPQLRADVVGPAPATEAPAVDAAAAAAATTTEATRELDRPAGGDAARAGQTGPQVDIPEAVGRGAAAGPEGSETPTGSPAPPRPPFRQQLERPVAVLVDNAAGYPQYGLRSASQVHEMPVEGGLTRLMLVFDRSDAERVGPVRSAREYFVELARSLDAVLVHDGGSPGALATIAATGAPTLNSFTRGELFSRGDGSAPYNLFAGGDALRDAVNRLDFGRGRTVTGTIYRPQAERDDALEVEVSYGGAYQTGFRYEPAIDAYRWVRSGSPASDAYGEAVLVDAVLVAAIDARAIPGDAEGRLYIPLRGGEATLFLFGKAVPGRWEVRPGLGVRFETDDGGVDLEAFKTWVVFTPNYDRTVVRNP
jgi:hypothetical protein